MTDAAAEVIYSWQVEYAKSGRSKCQITKVRPLRMYAYVLYMHTSCIKYVCIYVWYKFLYVYMHISRIKYACMYVCQYWCMYVSTGVCMVYIYICMYVCMMYVCMHAYV